MHGQPAGGDADLSLTPALRWFVFLWFVGYALCAASCRHAFTRDTHDRGKETESERWRTATTADQQQRATETAAKDQKQSGKGRARVTRPDGTKIEIDWDWVSETAERVRAHVETDSSSKSTAQGEKQREREHDKGAKTNARTSWWPPLWLLVLVGLAVASGVWYLRWRARRMRLL